VNKLYAYLEGLFFVSLGIIAPIKPLLATVGLLIVLDLISGMLASKKKKRKITSAAMSRTVAKMFLYNMCILSGFMIELYLIDHALPMAKIVAGVIGMVEFKSLLENTHIVTGVDIGKQIINKLSSKNLISNKRKSKKS
jgi:phage-related holin